MRILHILDHSIPLHSGYTFRTASILREQRALGWQTFHLTSPKQGETKVLEEDIAGLHFYRTPPKAPLLNLPGLREISLMRHLEARLLKVAKQVKPDLLHAHSPVLNAIPAIQVGKRLGIPVVYEIRAFWEDAAVDHGTTQEGSLRYKLTRALETSAIRKADHITTICEGLRQDIIGRGVDPAKITLIPNAVDIKDFTMGGVADPELKQRLGLEGRTVIGFIGSFYAYEGLDLLISAFPAMLEKAPNLRLLLVGGGPQERALKRQAREAGIADKVLFTGRVPHAEVQRYYDLIDVLCYPRHAMRLTELVTPLKPLEAMAQGRVFVASDVGGHKELIRHGETGILFKAGEVQALSEAVLSLLARRETWPDLRAAGRHYVETERNWARSVANYKPVFERLTGEVAA